MTLYKGTIEDEDLGDDEPQIEPAIIPLTLKIRNEATFGLESYGRYTFLATSPLFRRII